MTTNTKQFTFDFNFGKTSTPSTPSAPTVKQVTPGQLKYYTDLCKQKLLPVQPVGTFASYDDMSTEIARLLAYFPANTKQIELICTKIDSLTNIIQLMRFTEEQKDMFLSAEDNVVASIIGAILEDRIYKDIYTQGLTGGQEGTASLLIQGLIDIEKQFTDQLPPSIPQVEMLVNMFYYPEANFEEYGVPRRIDLGEGMWRKPTPEEFAEYIQDNMTKQEASGFIDTTRGGFYTWRQTRIRPEQVRYIQSLEKRLCDDSKISAVQQAVTLDGSIVDVVGSKNESIVGTAYVPLTEEQLLMFSIEDASEFINQLKSETETTYGTSLEVVQDNNHLRSNKSIKATIDEEFQDFQDLMFKLEAVAGYSNDELHLSANYNLVADDNPETSKENRLIIRDFMKELLKTGSISFYELIEMCKDSITAQRILLDM